MPFQKGCTPWNKGKTGVYSEETLKKISEALTGRKLSEETRRKISEALTGHPVSEETRRKTSRAMKGEKNPMYGKHRSEETRRKQSESLRGRQFSEESIGKRSGENHWNWKGGYEPYYGPDWQSQRRLVRERDDYTCICGEKENGREHDVHHIVPFRVYGIERYEEANRLENLMTLCPMCHTRIERRIESFWRS